MNRSWGADPHVVGRGEAHAYACAGRVAAVPSGLDPVGVDLAGAGRAEGVAAEQAPVTASPHLGLADQLAPMVGVWERLLVQHLPDRTGRCRTCTQGGTGLPGTPWPCALHGIAELAQRRHGLPRGA